MRATQVRPSEVRASSEMPSACEKLDSRLRGNDGGVSAGGTGHRNDGSATSGTKWEDDLVKNFVAQYRKPFSAEIMSGMTGVDESACRREISKLVKLGKIREAEPGIYMVNHSKEMSNSIWIGTSAWRFNVESGTAVLDQIEKGNNRGCRPIARKLKKSQQWAHMYLVALCSNGNVGYREGGYYVISRENMVRLGAKLERGIIGRLRREEKSET